MSKLDKIKQESLYMMENNTERIKAYSKLTDLYFVTNSQARDVFDRGADFGVEKCHEIMDKEKIELIECIQNLMGVFDTPIGRMKMPGEFSDEVRKNGRETLKKYIENK